MELVATYLKIVTLCISYYDYTNFYTVSNYITIQLINYRYFPKP